MQERKAEYRLYSLAGDLLLLPTSLPATPFLPNLQGPQFPMFNGEGKRVSKTKKRRGPAGLPLAGAELSEEMEVQGRVPQRARSSGRS